MQSNNMNVIYQMQLKLHSNKFHDSEYKTEHAVNFNSKYLFAVVSKKKNYLLIYKALVCQVT